MPEEYQVTADFLSRYPSIKVVSSTGSGYDTIDVQACSEAGVLVVNQAGGNAQSVAEHTFGLLLGLSHRIAESNDILRSGGGFIRESLMGNEIHGKTIGLVGLGQIGMRVARLAEAFGMEAIAYDPYLTQAEVVARHARPVSLDALLKCSDVVSLHCPRTSETVGMFGAREFSSMRAGAIFISTARGGIHDENALYEALTSGHLSGAGLDVWTVEPPPREHPLLSLPTVISTYHTAGVTHQGRTRVARISAEQIIEIAGGRKPARMINPQVFGKVSQRFPTDYSAPMAR